MSAPMNQVRRFLSSNKLNLTGLISHIKEAGGTANTYKRHGITYATRCYCISHEGGK